MVNKTTNRNMTPYQFIHILEAINLDGKFPEDATPSERKQCRDIADYDPSTKTWKLSARGEMEHDKAFGDQEVRCSVEIGFSMPMRHSTEELKSIFTELFQNLKLHDFSILHNLSIAEEHDVYTHFVGEDKIHWIPVIKQGERCEYDKKAACKNC